MNKKMCFCLLLKAGQHAKAGRFPEGVPQNCLFSVDFLLFYNVFQHFSTDFGVFLLIYRFQSAFGSAQHPKTGQNAQQTDYIEKLWNDVLNNKTATFF